MLNRPFHQAWRQRSRRPRPAGQAFIESAPFVDAALLFFIFFLVASPFVMQPGVLIRLPAAPFAQGARYGSLVVTISQEGMIFFNDERTTLDELGAAFTQAAREQPGDTLIVEADARVHHETLVQVYHLAMRAGLRDVALATQLAPAAPDPRP